MLDKTRVIYVTPKSELGFVKWSVCTKVLKELYVGCRKYIS